VNIVVARLARVARLLIAGTVSLTLTFAAVSSRAAQSAYDYNGSQIAPSIASTLSMSQLIAILNQAAPNTPYLDTYQQVTVTDSTQAIASLAPLKVVQTDDPAHRYLGVFHNQATISKFATWAAFSSDLIQWHTLGEIDDIANLEYGSQPDIRILSDDSVLFAEEYNPGKPDGSIPANKPHIRVRYYGNGAQTGLQAFIANPHVTPTTQIGLPNINAFSQADGTPEFGRIEYSGSIQSSKIEITHHYFNFGQRDIQAVGTLGKFRSWSDTTDTATNNLVTQTGGNGKIGDREVFEVGSTVYEVVEAQQNPTSGSDYGSWRLFLINKTAGTIQKLNPNLGGAQSLGNPTVSFVKLPDGRMALVFTCFVFGTNNGATPQGGHMYVYPFN
jgi:hypothetical protein